MALIDGGEVSKGQGVEVGAAVPAGPQWAKVIDQTLCIGCHACTVACKTAISSRSEIERKRPDGSARSMGGIPPASPNHRMPVVLVNPIDLEAASDCIPEAIKRQNARFSCRGQPSRPGCMTTPHQMGVATTP